MDQRRGLKRLAGLFLGQFLCRQLAQLVVDQRQQLVGGVRVALFDGREDAGDVGHEDEHTVRVYRSQTPFRITP